MSPRASSLPRMSVSTTSLSSPVDSSGGCIQGYKGCIQGYGGWIHLEVHVPEGVFAAEDVGEHHVPQLPGGIV
eukprot:960646-Prorocentrum_minimum.AAC.2